MSKLLLERLMKLSLDTPKELVERKGLGTRIVPGPYARPGTDVAKQELEAPLRKRFDEEAAILAADTEINRKERKPIVHKILSEKIYRPGDITKRVYAEVLHCDLEDPYLGLISGAFGGGAYENR